MAARDYSGYLLTLPRIPWERDIATTTLYHAHPRPENGLIKTRVLSWTIFSGMEEPETLDLESAAELCKCAPSTLRIMAKAGSVPCAKVGRRWVFIKSDLIDYIRSQYKPSYLEEKPPGIGIANSPIRKRRLDALLGGRRREARKVKPFHSKKRPGVYHLNANCRLTTTMKKENKARGTGNGILCKGCEKMFDEDSQ